MTFEMLKKSLWAGVPTPPFSYKASGPPPRLTLCFLILPFLSNQVS